MFPKLNLNPIGKDPIHPLIGDLDNSDRIKTPLIPPKDSQVRNVSINEYDSRSIWYLILSPRDERGTFKNHNCITNTLDTYKYYLLCFIVLIIDNIDNWINLRRYLWSFQRVRIKANV